jgi:hypothetical protein
MRTNQRLVATVVSAAALAAPAAASAMPAELNAGGSTPEVRAAPARNVIVESGAGTVTMVLLTVGGLTAGMAGGLGGTRLRRRHSLA